MAFRLRSDIKMFARVNGRTRYPFYKMKVGDSFAVPLEEVGRVRVSASLFGKNSAKIKKNRMKFAVQRVDPMDKTSGYRCWRVK